MPGSRARSFSTWTDRDGTRRGSFAFDDEGGAWIDAIIATALRPRRGGPRFVDSDEKARAEELANDPRTNEQLAYDLVIDVLRAGALADAESVFGTRQAGIRVVVTDGAHADALAGRPAVALLEDADVTLPGWLAATRCCDSGTITVIHDAHGNPLDLGREARLYSAKQRPRRWRFETVDAASPAATDPPRTVKRITSTRTPRAGAPTSIGASCCAAFTT